VIAVLIVGKPDLRPSYEIRVELHGIPMTDQVESLLKSDYSQAPLLEFLQIESKRVPPVLYIVNGKLGRPLADPVLEALGLSRPARMTSRVLGRILDIKARELVLLLASVLGRDEPIEVKYPGLWLG
jgi:hypothetical protein